MKLSEYKFNIQEAYDFYRKFIYNTEHQQILRDHDFSIPGSVAPVNCEVFASILTGDNGKLGYGSDLNHFEVKSAISNSGFEYQYHLNGGKTKLLDDMVVDHIFVSYSKDYSNIVVRIVPGSELKEIFESWMPGLIANYEGENPRQRYRKGFPFGLVKSRGRIILETIEGRLV